MSSLSSAGSRIAAHRPADDHDRLIAGRFEVLRTLGEGSFAVVYEALDLDLDRRVALKLFTSYADDELEAAVHEARAMAAMRHEHVLVVHDIGEHRGSPFLALEYAQTDLRRWLASKRRDVAAILTLYRQAGRGLAAAHRANLVHHDFKPANVMLRADGSAAVGDFGLARRQDGHDEHGDQHHGDQHHGDDRRRRYAFGTLRYIAPERLLGAAGDARSDQFSFCVALWESLADRHPFTGSDAERRYASIVAGPSGDPLAPAAVLRALRRGMSVDPDDRFASMDDLLAAFDAPRVTLRRGLGSAVAAGLAVAVFVLGVGLSRSAPALDVTTTPAPVLTTRAALQHATALAFDGEAADAVSLIRQVMPMIAEADRQQQLATLYDLEMIADVLDGEGEYLEATKAYAMCLALAKRAGLESALIEGLDRKRSLAQARARAATRADGGTSHHRGK